MLTIEWLRMNIPHVHCRCLCPWAVDAWTSHLALKVFPNLGDGPPPLPRPPSFGPEEDVRMPAFPTL